MMKTCLNYCLTEVLNINSHDIASNVSYSILLLIWHVDQERANKFKWNLPTIQCMTIRKLLNMLTCLVYCNFVASCTLVVPCHNYCKNDKYLWNGINDLRSIYFVHYAKDRLLDLCTHVKLFVRRKCFYLYDLLKHLRHPPLKSERYNLK